MARTLVAIIIAAAVLAVGFLALCQFFLGDVLPYAAGEDEVVSWQREVAVLLKALAWISAEVSGLFAIVLGGHLWKQRSIKVMTR
ncbi:MAG: hypothetical protein ACI4XG_04425 [Bradyrhizobium sp.]